MAAVIHFPVDSGLIAYYTEHGYEAFAVENGQVYLRLKSK